jgi:glycosyltransferase involved in cell wall biosynthesis
MGALAVHHFGPHQDTVGGIASVIRVLVEHGVGADQIAAHPTWKPHSPFATARLSASSANALVRLPPTRVAHVHLSERGSFLREGALLALARRRNLIAVATIHGAVFASFARRRPRLVSAVLRCAQAVICLDPEALEIARLSAPGARCEIIPNPVSIDADFAPADETAELVLFAGEIGLRKGADVLHRAWELVAQRRPGARCVMVGPPGDFTPPPAERLQVSPPVSAAEMRRLMRLARVVALPARAEGMPMALTEAMSAGRPFVSTAVGGVPSLASEGGLLVDVGDELALAERLTDLLADPQRARALGERGRDFCIRTRGIETVDGRLRELYRAAARNRRSTALAR